MLAKIGLPQLEKIEDLTSDVQLRELLATCRQAILHLSLENDSLRRKFLGSKSEKVSRDEITRQLVLFADLIDELKSDGPEPSPPAIEPEIANEIDEAKARAEEQAASKKKKKRGRQARKIRVPADIPTRTQVEAVPANERGCPSCGHEMTKELEPERSERLEWVPGHFEKIVIEREKLACPCCHGAIVTAPAPSSPIPKGIPGPALLATVIIGKFLLHLPLYRQVAAMIFEHGVSIPLSTLCGWIQRSATLFDPIYQVMVADVLRSKVIHTDDTGVRVQERHSDSETGKVRLWPYIGDDEHPHVVFDYTTSRKRDGPAAFLSGFTGYLQADAYAGYDAIFAGGAVIEVACWTHARRYVFNARDADPARAYVILDLIDQLYDIERLAKSLSPAARLALRQRESRPIIETLRRRLDAYTLECLPKGPMGKAIKYINNQWVALTRYLDDPSLDIDNNDAERAIRPIAVGRRNWLFVGSDRAGHSMAVIYSLLASCLRVGANPFEYLSDVLRRAPEQPIERMWELTPDAWCAAREAGVAPSMTPAPVTAGNSATASAR